MPAATKYWTQMELTAVRTLQGTAEEERRKRGELYRLACDQYDGKHKKFLKQREGGVDPNVIINLDGEAIDQIIAFAVPDMPRFQTDEVADLTATETPPADEGVLTDEDVPTVGDAAITTTTEMWIEEAWADNDGAGFLQDCLLYGCLIGHVYVRVLPPKPGDSYPRALVLNPSTVISYWRSDDMRTVLWHEICYTTNRKYRIDFVNEVEIGGKAGVWGIYTYVYEGNEWKLQGKASSWTYAQPPIVQWQHLRNPRQFYGKSHIIASGLNDSVNKVASDIKQILRYHASPRTIGKGVNAKEVEATSIDGFFTVPKDADIKNLEMQSDLTSSMNFYETLRAAHADEMRVVRMTGGLEAFKGITNFGLRVAFMKMNAQNTQLHRNYERGLIGITRSMLAVGSKNAEVKLDIEWPDALPVSDTEETFVAQQQKDMGLLSKQTASNKLGLDYGKEQERIAAEGDIVDEQARRKGQGGEFFSNQPTAPNDAEANPFGANGNGQAVSNAN